MNPTEDTSKTEQPAEGLSAYLAQRISSTPLPQQLAIIRTLMKLSQAELAKKSGVRQADVSQIETDPDQTKLGHIRKIAETLGLKLTISFSSLDKTPDETSQIVPPGVEEPK